jgi:teichuronic acid biosynthesis glycosyltransferase TuaC
MKVLFVSSGNSESGISPIVRNQGESLKNHGIDINYFIIKGKGGIGYFKHIFRLKRFLKKNKFDIIHAHYGLCGIVSNLALKSKKLVVSYMGDDLLGSSRRNGSYSIAGKFYVSLNKWFACKRNDFNIVKSKEMSQVLRNARHEIIPNGVNFEKFHPIEKNIARGKLNIPADKKLIVFAANPERPEKNIRLAREAVDRLNLPGAELKILYNISQEELNLYYNGADLLLLTSFHEGSPNVIKEAMACNCPIVSTDVGDVKEMIKDTEGCCISSFNAKEAAGEIKKALEFGKRTKGRKNISHLEINKIAQKIIRVYEKILGY